MQIYTILPIICFCSYFYLGMENTYSNGSYIPRASPSYSDSIGPLSPSYAGSHLNSNSNELNEDRRLVGLNLTYIQT